MWKENDEMLSLSPQIEIGNCHFPTTCPVCGKATCHILIHRYDEDSALGTLWIWCDSCHNFDHVSYRVPEWWSNPNFIDDEKLDSTVVYPASLEDEIDAWLNQLTSS